MRPPSLYVESLGLYLPESYPTVNAIAEGLWTEDHLERWGWTGVAVAGDISAPDMAVVAAQEALSRSRYGPEDVTLLLHGGTGFQGPHGWMPHHYVQRHALGGHAAAAQLGVACNSSLLGLSLAAGYLGLEGGDRAVLITGADNWGFPWFNRFGYAEGVTERGSIIGDAASAVVVSPTGGFARVKTLCNASLPAFEEMWREEGPMFPPPLDVPGSTDLPARTRTFMQTHPERLPDLMCDFLDLRRDLIATALDEADIGPDDVRRVTHVFSGTPGYIEGIVRPFGIPPERGMLELGRQLGHLSVTDHIASLVHLIVTGQVAEGDHVLMVNNGAGMSLTVAVIELLEVPDWPPPVRYPRVVGDAAPASEATAERTAV